MLSREMYCFHFFCFHCFLKPNGVQGKLSLQRASLAASEAIARTPTKEKKKKDLPKTGFITIAMSNWVSFLVHATLDCELCGNYLFYSNALSFLVLVTNSIYLHVHVNSLAAELSRGFSVKKQHLLHSIAFISNK
jgi:hypothetical protein